MDRGGIGLENKDTEWKEEKNTQKLIVSKLTLTIAQKYSTPYHNTSQ